jgi:hypothetical protein
MAAEEGQGAGRGADRLIDALEAGAFAALILDLANIITFGCAGPDVPRHWQAIR